MEMSRKMIIVFATCDVDNMISTMPKSDLANKIVFAPEET